MKLKTSLVAGAFSLVLFIAGCTASQTPGPPGPQGQPGATGQTGDSSRDADQRRAEDQRRADEQRRGDEQRGADEQNGPTTRLEEVMTNHVRQESIAIQTPVREKRVASETNDLSGNFRVQANTENNSVSN